MNASDHEKSHETSPSATDEVGFWDDADIISSYSRANAIEDGELVDVSATAKEAGFKFPVALTRAVWDQYVETHGLPGQDEAGRLWDVLFMLRCAIKTARQGSDTMRFQVIVLMPGRGVTPKHQRVTLKSICGPGDTADPTITILLPEED